MAGIDSLTDFEHSETQSGSFSVAANDALTFEKDATSGEIIVKAKVEGYQYAGQNNELATTLVHFGRCGRFDADEVLLEDSTFGGVGSGCDTRILANGESMPTGGNCDSYKFDKAGEGERMQPKAGYGYTAADKEGRLGDATCYAYEKDELNALNAQAKYGTLFPAAPSDLSSGLLKHYTNQNGQNGAGGDDWDIAVSGSGAAAKATYTSKMHLSELRNKCTDVSVDGEGTTTFYVAQEVIRPSQLLGMYPSGVDAQNKLFTTCSERKFEVSISSTMRAVMGATVSTGANFKVKDVQLVSCTGVTNDGRSGDACTGAGVHSDEKCGELDNKSAYKMKVTLQIDLKDRSTYNMKYAGLRGNTVTAAGTPGAWAGDVYTGRGGANTESGYIRGPVTSGSSVGAWTVGQFGFGGHDADITRSSSTYSDGEYTTQTLVLETDCINIDNGVADGCRADAFSGDYSLQFKFSACSDVNCLEGGSPGTGCDTKCVDFRGDMDGEDTHGLEYAKGGSKWFPLTLTIDQPSCPAEFFATEDESTGLNEGAEIFLFDDMFHPAAVNRKALLTDRPNDVGGTISTGRSTFSKLNGIASSAAAPAEFSVGRTVVAAVSSTDDEVTGSYSAWLTDVKLCYYTDDDKFTNALTAGHDDYGCTTEAAGSFDIVEDGVPKAFDTFNTIACKHDKNGDATPGPDGTTSLACPDANNNLLSSNKFYTSTSAEEQDGTCSTEHSVQGCGRGAPGARYMCDWDLTIANHAAWDAVSFSTQKMLVAAQNEVGRGNVEATKWVIDMSAKNWDCSAGDVPGQQRRLRAVTAHTFADLAGTGDAAAAAGGFVVTATRSDAAPTAPPTLSSAGHHEEHRTHHTERAALAIAILALVLTLLRWAVRARRNYVNGAKTVTGTLFNGSKYRTRSTTNSNNNNNPAENLAAPRFRIPAFKR